MNEEHWGGAIDALATALDYETEIAIISLPAKSVQTFGKGKGFPNRVFLLYDHDHYDALYQKVPIADESDSVFSHYIRKYLIVGGLANETITP